MELGIFAFYTAVWRSEDKFEMPSSEVTEEAPAPLHLSQRILDGTEKLGTHDGSGDGDDAPSSDDSSLHVVASLARTPTASSAHNIH